MVCSTSRLVTVGSLSYPKPARRLEHGLKGFDSHLLAETAVVTITAILTIRTLSASCFSHTTWFMAPFILVAAALVPTAARKTEFAQIGLTAGQIRQAMVEVCRVCAIALPALFLGLWLLRCRGLEPPLQPAAPQNRQLPCWLFYQFMYVAVAEEVFFRGYLQSNVLRLVEAHNGQKALQSRWVSILLAAACFAGAHVLVQGQIGSIVTFLPGVILGWLFVKTRSLLAPILFHGIANVSYCIMATVIA